MGTDLIFRSRSFSIELHMGNERVSHVVGTKYKFIYGARKVSKVSGAPIFRCSGAPLVLAGLRYLIPPSSKFTGALMLRMA